MTVTGNRRLIFRYNKRTNSAGDIDLVDYHSRKYTMPMKNPPHPGELVKTEIIEALGLSVSKAAGILGVRRATLSDLVNGKSALTAEMALRIEKAFGPDMDHLLRMQLAYDIARMRQRSGKIAIKPYKAA
jgi:antitoxin HigA-1